MITVPGKKQGEPLSDGAYNGGIMTMDENWPNGVPTHWAVYFHVADTDAAVAKLTELGGNVVVPAMDTSASRISIVRDPQGRMFSLISPPAEA